MVSARARLEWNNRCGSSLYPDVIACLEAIKQRKIPMGVITQTVLANDEFRRIQLKKHNIEHFFKVVVTSESAGYNKPDSKLYRKAVESAGFSPQEILHVGDSYEFDVKGAISIGMIAVLLDRVGDSTYKNVKKISSLLQLDELARSL